MADMDFYRQLSGFHSREEVVDGFLDTLAATNRAYDYYVDWDKVKANINGIRTELNILNTITSSKTPNEAEEEFRKLAHKYPEVIEALPVLIACRLKDLQQFVCLLPFQNSLTNGDSTVTICFDRGVVQDHTKMDRLCDFCRGVGIFDLLSYRDVHDLVEYSLGVEVGMDTNARKNRSGTAMQDALEPHVLSLANNNPDIAVISQCTRRDLAKRGVSASFPIDRTMDFVVLKCDNGSVSFGMDIETNYFGTTGSKPDIINSYIERQRQLQQEGWSFLLVTDGAGWKGMRSTLEEALVDLDYVLNLHQVKQGALAALLRHLKAIT
jgi:type II restriction enzyme